MESTDMPENDKLSLFVNAPPVAVFSVLTDVRNRANMLSAVRKVRLDSPLPVDKGSSFREWRNGSIRIFGNLYRIVAYSPPADIAFSVRSFLLDIDVPLSLKADQDGTYLTGQVNARSRILPGFLLALFARPFCRHWARQFEADLMEMKRHVEPRANPAWRDRLRSRKEV